MSAPFVEREGHGYARPGGLVMDGAAKRRGSLTRALMNQVDLGPRGREALEATEPRAEPDRAS